MTMTVRMLVVSMVLAALLGSIYVSGPSQAAQGADDMAASIKKIAAALKKGDKTEAKKLAAAAAKEIDDVGPAMHMLRPRKKDGKGGIGVGEKPGANPAKDGIEVTLRDLGRDVPANVGKQAEALEATGYHIAAIAEIALAKGWGKNEGKKTKVTWNEYSEELGKLGFAFSKAAAGKGAQEIKTAASKLNENCNRCHSVFKE